MTESGPVNTECVNIASHLPAMARQHPDTPAVIVQHGRAPGGGSRYTTYTLEQLDLESDCLARGLERVGIGQGTRTVLMVKPGLEFFALTFALFKVGAVLVMVDPGMGVKNLGACLAEAGPAAFIGIPKAHAARMVLGWARATVTTLVTIGPRLFWRGHTWQDVRIEAEAPYEMAQTRGEDTAAILFTSGNTGVPKGAVYTHGIFDAQVRSIRDVYGIEPGEMDVATFPLFALFGPALGMAAVIPDMDASRPADADPKKIIEAIERFEATNMFGSPALIKNVGRYGTARGIRLPSLRRVISAGAPADTEALENLSAMLAPDVEVFTPYGATEALPVASIGSTAILGETAAKTAEGAGTCVGKPVCPGSVAVIRITDDPIPEWTGDLELPDGEIGEIVVCSPVTTRTYYNRPQATALAKIVDAKDGSVYHRMGDVGHFDGQGRLWFCGRKSHRVVTPAGTLFTIPCERVFDTHPKVARTALVGVEMDGETMPVLCVELERNARGADRATIERELLAIGASRPHTASIETFLFHRKFPVDIRHNAKITREKLAVWAGRVTLRVTKDHGRVTLPRDQDKK